MLSRKFVSRGGICSDLVNCKTATEFERYDVSRCAGKFSMAAPFRERPNAYVDRTWLLRWW